jgi:Leucine-rich repeat (LRR) protein
MAQANNGVVIQHVGECFLNQVDVNDMTRGQLEIRAIRKILDSGNVNRRNLPAVSESFEEIADDVTEIDIHSYDLRVVPECINRLTGCRCLNLGRCKLNRDDSFPDTLWQLTGLEILGLYLNNLTSIPSQIGQLSSLTYLDLSYNILVSLPDEIYQLTNLTELVLYNNKLESISEEIGKLTKLTLLGLSSYQLKKLPKAIGKLVNLENNRGLDIYGNPLTSLPDSIRKVKHALSNISKKEYKLLLEDVETRAAQRLQRRLVILLAKESPSQSTATKDKIISLINDVLKDL